MSFLGLNEAERLIGSLTRDSMHETMELRGSWIGFKSSRDREARAQINGNRSINGCYLSKQIPSGDNQRQTGTKQRCISKLACCI